MGFRCVCFFFRVVYILWYVYNCGSFVKWGIVVIFVVVQVIVVLLVRCSCLGEMLYLLECGILNEMW